MTDPAVPPRTAAGAEPATLASPSSAIPSSALPSSAAEVADLFEVLATSADWSVTVDQDALFPVAVSPAERAIADLVAAGARTQLARLDPPMLLAGVAEWAARHPDAADAARASVAGRVDLCWPAEAGA